MSFGGFSRTNPVIAAFLFLYAERIRKRYCGYESFAENSTPFVVFQRSICGDLGIVGGAGKDAALFPDASAARGNKERGASREMSIGFSDLFHNFKRTALLIAVITI